MGNFFFIAALVCMAGVLLSLFRGLWAMTKDTKKEHQTSNFMMRMRVSFQALAILFLVLAYFAR